MCAIRWDTSTKHFMKLSNTLKVVCNMIEKLHFSIEGEHKVWNKYTYF